MWKLWILVIGGLALLPFAVLADTGGSASAKLTFSSVINVAVTDNWSDLTIDQTTIAGWASATFPIVWTKDALTVKVQALTGFNVYAAYNGEYSGTGTPFTLPDDLADEDSFLYLDNDDLDPAKALPYNSTLTVAGISNHGYSNTSASGNDDLTMLTDWTGDPTISGETRTYDVLWDPSQLPDLEKNDAITLTIYVLVTDDDT